MRRLVALIALIALLALGTAAYGPTFPEPRTIRINDRVYVLLGPIQHANRLNQGYMINSTAIVGDKGVILNWLRTLDEIQTLGVVHFVPGHGDLMTVSDITGLRDAMLHFYSGVEEGFRNGRSRQIASTNDRRSWHRSRAEPGT